MLRAGLTSQWVQEADWDAGDWQQRGVRHLPALLLSITASYGVTGTCQLPDLSSPGSSCLSALSTPGIPAGKEHSTSLLAAVSSPCVPAGAGDVGRLCRAGRALPCLTWHPSWEGRERERSCPMWEGGRVLRVKIIWSRVPGCAAEPRGRKRCPKASPERSGSPNSKAPSSSGMIL